MAERENVKVWSGRPGSPVDFRAGAARERELKLFKKMQPFVIMGVGWNLFSVLTIYSDVEKVVNRNAWESSFDDWGDCLLRGGHHQRLFL